mgnify:CR=1 FL=1
MTMQKTPLLMHRLMDRGAMLQPEVEVMTATEDGVRSQTMLETRNRAHQLAHALNEAGIGMGILNTSSITLKTRSSLWTQMYCRCLKNWLARCHLSKR